jgi:hypothetical protein
MRHRAFLNALAAFEMIEHWLLDLNLLTRRLADWSIGLGNCFERFKANWRSRAISAV